MWLFTLRFKMYGSFGYIFSFFILYLKVLISSKPLNNDSIDGYGTKWIYFPDGDGDLHYVNLSISDEDYMNPTRGLMNNQIQYRLYTRNSNESYILLDEMGKPVGDYDLFEILSSKPLKIITHGWISSPDTYGVVNIKNAYLEAQDVNVITVDWSDIAASLLYHSVAMETKNVGTRIAVFLNTLHKQFNVCEQQIHLIGHSLGAHVVGVAASNANFTIARVTGLDPARPLFEYPVLDNSAKLDASDAVFVDVIHTCSGVLGFESAIGTVDFYPNNGIAPQPGCETLQRIFEACSHGRAYYYFEESIKYSKAFPAYQCQSWTEYLQHRCDHNTFMGESVSRNITGKFYLKTNPFKPFGLRS